MQKFSGLFLITCYIFSHQALATSQVCEDYFERLWTWAGAATQQIDFQPAAKCLDTVESERKEIPLIPKSCEKRLFSKMSNSYQAKWSVQLDPEPKSEASPATGLRPRFTLKEVSNQFQVRRLSSLNLICHEKMAGAIFHYPGGKIHQSASPDPR